MTGTINVSVFPDVFARTCTPQNLDLLFLEHFPPDADKKEKLQLLKLAQFGDKKTKKHSLRHDDNVLSVNGLELDYDAEEHTMEEAAQKLQQASIESFLYTSPSHTKDNPRWRILVPFANEFADSTKTMRAYRKAGIQRIEEALGFTVASESYALSQAFYYGKVPGTEYKATHIEGKFIDQKFDLRESSLDCTSADGPDTYEVLNMSNLVRQVVNGSNFHQSLRDLAASFAAKSMGEKDIVRILQALLAGSAGGGTERWQERWDEIPGLVKSAMLKFSPVSELQLEIPDQLPELNLDYICSTPPPPRKFLFLDADGHGIMPEGEGCGMAGAGGGGKSTLMLDLALSLTTGQTWLGHYRPVDRCPVFFFTKEDSEDELHRRVWNITGQDPGSLHPENLHIYPLLGVDFPLTTVQSGKIVNGPAVERITYIVNQHGGNGVVILDPLRKMSVGKEDGEAMTAAVNACDSIRLKTSGMCTTLLLHHSSKESVRNQDTTAGAFRGASDLVDGLRWTMILAKLGLKERTKLSDGSNWRRITMPKTNYTEADDDGILIAWDNGRFVVQATPPGLQKAQTANENAQQLYKLLLESGPLTRRDLAQKFHSETGPIFAAKREVDVVIKLGMSQKLIESTKIEKDNKQSYEGWKARDDVSDG